MATEALAHAYVELYPAEAARTLDGVAASEVAALLAGQDPAPAASLLERMASEGAAGVLEALDGAAAARILEAAEPLRTAPVLARLDAPTRERLLADLRPAAAAEYRELLAHSAGTAGAIMDPRVPSFPADLAAGDLLDRLHSLRQRRVRDLLLVDGDGRLAGAVPLLDAILAEPRQRLVELAAGPSPSVQATASQEEVLDTLAGARLSGLPVVDAEGRLIGIIRQPAVVQAAQEHALGSVQAMVGAGRDERALSSPLFSVSKRLPWLNINLLTAFLAAAVVGLFEDTISRFTALAVLLPVVAGQSGNAGAQALAVTMRGLALREVRVRHWPRLLLKEGTVGLINGVAIAVVTAGGVWLWSGSPGLSGVIGVAMVVSMGMAGVAGTAIPVLLTALGQDPAQSSSIVLTTVTDVVGFGSFLGLATLASGWL